jgi:hypothetical protein
VKGTIRPYPSHDGPAGGAGVVHAAGCWAIRRTVLAGEAGVASDVWIIKKNCLTAMHPSVLRTSSPARTLDRRDRDEALIP